MASWQELWEKRLAASDSGSAGNVSFGVPVKPMLGCLDMDKAVRIMGSLRASRRKGTQERRDRSQGLLSILIPNTPLLSFNCFSLKLGIHAAKRDEVQ